MEDDQLTHMGKSIDEINHFGPMESDDEDSGAIDFRTVRGSHFGGFGDEDKAMANEDEHRNKSKAEVMKEVIAKSKLHKHERQKQKEEDFELGEELDAELDEVRRLLDAKGADGKAPLPSRGLPSQRDAYDLFVRELATEKRAVPTDRLKTEEEVALEEKEKLEKLEGERLKRMRDDNEGDEDIDKSRSKRAPRADDLDDDFQQSDASKDIAPLAYCEGKIINDTIFMTPKHSRDENDASEENVEFEESEEEGDDESESGEEELEEDDDMEDEDEEKVTKKNINSKRIKKGAVPAKDSPKKRRKTK